MKQFYPLTVASKIQEARDAIRIGLDVPAELRDEFAFLPGQHLPIQIERDGKSLRRTYSICSAEGCWPLEIGVRVQPGGRFSEYAARDLNVGDALDDAVAAPSLRRADIAGRATQAPKKKAKSARKR